MRTTVVGLTRGLDADRGGDPRVGDRHRGRRRAAAGSTPTPSSPPPTSSTTLLRTAPPGSRGRRRPAPRTAASLASEATRTLLTAPRGSPCRPSSFALAGMRTVRLETSEPSPACRAELEHGRGRVPGAAVSTVGGPWPTTSIRPPLAAREVVERAFEATRADHDTVAARGGAAPRRAPPGSSAPRLRSPARFDADAVVAAPAPAGSERETASTRRRRPQAARTSTRLPSPLPGAPCPSVAPGFRAAQAVTGSFSAGAGAAPWRRRSSPSRRLRRRRRGARRIRAPACGR